MKQIKIYAILVLTLFASVGYAQINIKDSIQAILQNDTIDAETRFREANNLIFYHAPAEEAEPLALNVVYPFVQKTWKNQSEQLSRLSRLYVIVGFCYRERGGDDRTEKERHFAEKALDIAKESGNDTICARCCMACGYMEIKRGDVKRAHNYLYQAIKYYDNMKQYVKSSEMLYVIASNFFEIKDTDGMQRILRQMENYLQKDTSKQSYYQYNVIKKSYFELLLEKENVDQKPIDYRLVDSVLLYTKHNIALVDNFLGELAPNWMHGYAYWYLAKALDDYYPKLTDSISLYLDKALEMIEIDWYSRTNEKNSVLELKIYINEIRAKVYSRQGRIQDAFRCMNEALTMLDELKDYQNLNEQRYKAYQFMADYYEKNNRPGEALKFQKLLRESEANRYENEKVQAINDMSAKYETEKKEIQIQTLTKEKKIAQRTLWLLVVLSLVLLGTSALMVWSNRLRRKNVEQQLYETALLAELRQSELEKVQSQKQQLKQNPVQNTVEKVIQMVSDSLIEKNTKKDYLERLSKIDSELFEHAYQTSEVKITSMDMKYIICFSTDIDVKDISLLFNIEPASVHTVRYRIKKKFSKEDSFRMIL
ncbi:MAG: hypothetical protein LBU91_02710 [Bacteroidales bacterium]|jgi:hypothetical protein|nr:hypothetical protein [Bacteroidales bacterium]